MVNYWKEINAYVVKFSIILLLILFPTFSYSFNLAVTASGGNGTWDKGKYTVAVGSKLDFTCTPSGDSSLYRYEWDFDDEDSFTNLTTSQNPRHTFNYLGEHEVWVSVINDSSEIERALIIIDVLASVGANKVNAVTDCGLDNSGISDCASSLASCIENYKSSYGLRVEFPSGTYRFNAKSDGTQYYGIKTHQNSNEDIIEFVGIGETRPTLKFYVPNPAQYKAHFFVNGARAPNIINYYGFKNLIIESDLTAWGNDPNNYDNKVELLRHCDSNGPTYFVNTAIQNCDLKNFTRIYANKTRLIKNNISGFGVWNNGGANVLEAIRINEEGLSRRNYITNGANGHSHLHYNTGAKRTHIIGNYMDGQNAGGGKLILQLKMAMTDVTVKSNILKNSTGYMILLGGVGGNLQDDCNVVVKDNRLYNSASPSGKNIGFWAYSNTFDLILENNHFHSVRASIVSLSADSGEARVTYRNNVEGYDTTIGSYDRLNCLSAGGCSLNATNNIDDDTKFISTDPSGWYNETGYIDPGPWEYAPPINCLVGIDKSTISALSLFATDSGSGMFADARFPLKKGALVQISNDEVTWSEVRSYSESTSWMQSNNNSVFVRFRDRHGNWSLPASTTASIIRLLAPKNVHIID